MSGSSPVVSDLTQTRATEENQCPVVVTLCVYSMRDCVTDDNNSDRLSVHSILFPLRFPFEYLVVRSVGRPECRHHSGRKRGSTGLCVVLDGTRCEMCIRPFPIKGNKGCHFLLRPPPFSIVIDVMDRQAVCCYFVVQGPGRRRTRLLLGIASCGELELQ